MHMDYKLLPKINATQFTKQKVVINHKHSPDTGAGVGGGAEVGEGMHHYTLTKCTTIRLLPAHSQSETCVCVGGGGSVI